MKNFMIRTKSGDILNLSTHYPDAKMYIDGDNLILRAHYGGQCLTFPVNSISWANMKHNLIEPQAFTDGDK